MASDADYRLDLLRALGAELYLGATLRRVADNLLDCRLRTGPIHREVARQFVARYHDHCRAPPTCAV